MRIFLCDDSHAFAAAVGFWLEEADDLQLVGVAHDRAEAMASLARRETDVVLLDTMVSGEDELASTTSARRRRARRSSSTAATSRMPRASSCSGEPDLYLPKGDEPEHLIDALRGLR